MGSGLDVGQQCVAENAPTKMNEASSKFDSDPSAQQLAGNQAVQSLFGRGGTAPTNVCRREEIPDHPLAEYYNLFLALPPSDIRDLENAARRREYLRRGLPYTGPPGSFIAQRDLQSFLPPEETGFLPREFMLAQFMPLLLEAARAQSDPAALVLAIARNEAARNYIERIPHGLVSVELVDHDGLMKNAPSALRFSVGVTPVKDLHGLIPLINLDPLSPRKFELEMMVCTHNAEQLRDLALLQSQTEQGLKDALPVAVEMAMEPQKFALKEVVQLTTAVKDFRKRIHNLTDVLTGPNADQRPLLSAIEQQSAVLEMQADTAQTVALRFAHETEPDITGGEVYSEHEEERENDLSDDWEEGGWGYGKSIFHGLDWGTTKIFHGIGTAVTGGYMHLEAKNATAYRRGDISYETYNSNVYWNMGKSLVVAAVTALTAGFGGESAVALFGLETGGTATAAYATTYGMGAGFTGGFTGAVSSDTFSLLASHTSSDPGVQAMQRSDVVGPAGWLSSASMGGIVGGVLPFATSRIPSGPPGVPTPSESLTPMGSEVSTLAQETNVLAPESSTLAPETSSLATETGVSTSEAGPTAPGTQEVAPLGEAEPGATPDANTPASASGLVPAGGGQAPSSAGTYETFPGEVLGDVAPEEMPAAPPGSGPFGSAMERPGVRIVSEKFPDTVFRFRTGPGNTGPDVEWIGGKDPGFDIADFKPDSPSGYQKFMTQARLWGGHSWRGGQVNTGGPFRAAFFSYTENGTFFVGDIATVGGPSGTVSAGGSALVK